MDDGNEISIPAGQGDEFAVLIAAANCLMTRPAYDNLIVNDHNFQKLKMTSKVWMGPDPWFLFTQDRDIPAITHLTAISHTDHPDIE
jgi:hypothetical protein